MYTRCPTCSTCFRVTDRHLAIAKGKVRCGQCQLVFNAPENAIDDLPVNPVTAKTSNKPAPPVTTGTPKTEVIKPLTPSQDYIIAPTAKDKRKTTLKSTEEKKPQAPVFKKTPAKKPVYDADATMIADINDVDKSDINIIDPGAAPATSAIHDISDEDDDLFDDSFDLNAAIDELNQAAEDENKLDEEDIIVIEEESTTKKSEKYLPAENNSDDVFNTDAYDATNASSVSDILNEMEGQLSLDIAKPEDEDDVNDEFEFIVLDDEDETNDETLKKHFDINEFGFDDTSEDDEFDGNTAENDNIEENIINEDKLFDQVDLSDFQDSDIGESIVLEDPLLESSQKINIGQHSVDDENDIPFQLRNDLERLQAPSQRRLHPLIGVSFFITLLVLSFSQLAYFRAHELVNLVPSSRPLLEAFCESVGCHYSGPRDTKQIKLLSRDVRLHPKEKNALLISAAMINNAYFAQPYPDIHIRLSDISGNVVAERIFNAKTYMGKLSNPFLLMKSKTPVHINFEVVDPGKDAINFEFTFL